MEVINFKARKKINLASVRDLFDISEEWELVAWPISYNEAVSFIFRNVKDGDVLENGPDKTYRFKIFAVSDFDFSNAKKWDIELEGKALVTAFYWENGYASVVRDEDDYASVLFYDVKEAVTDTINLGRNVDRLMVTKDGRIVVGYIGSHPDDYPCFAVLAPNGKIIYQCQEPSARACIDLTVDSDDNVWASCYPDVSIYEVLTDGKVLNHIYPVASPDTLIPFKLNDKPAMILSYGGDTVYVPVNYLYAGQQLYELKFDDLGPKDIKGLSAFAGLVIALTADDKLYFFKLDDVTKVLE